MPADLFLIITLGVGVCDTGADWCADPVGHISIAQEIYKSRDTSFTLDINASHDSDLNNGEDLGVNMLMIRINKKFDWTLQKKDEQ